MIGIRRGFVLGLIAVAMSALGCPGTGPAPLPPPPDADAMPPPSSTSGCAEAYKALVEFGCPEAPTFMDACGVAQNGRRDIDPPFFPKCISTARTREELRACKAIGASGCKK